MEDCAMGTPDIYPNDDVKAPRREEDQAAEVNGADVAVDAVDGKDDEKKGGILNNLLANLVAPLSPRASADTTTGDEAAPLPTRGGEEEVAAEKEGSGGIIENIVSHLPKSLPEDVDPSNDEASILIHAIVHD
ncbi:hypothetical protein LINPERPRIM_LOCUS16178 [Linum perenne]